MSKHGLRSLRLFGIFKKNLRECFSALWKVRRVAAWSYIKHFIGA